MVHVGSFINSHSRYNDVSTTDSAIILNSAFNLILAAAAVAALITTLGALYLLYKTLEETRKMVVETNKIGTAQTKCYVSIEDVKMTLDNNFCPAVLINVYNSGNSPALLCHAVVKIVCDVHPENESARQDAFFMNPVMIGDIPSKSHKENAPMFFISDKLDDLKISNDGEYVLFCSIILFAKDVFNNEVMSEYHSFHFIGSTKDGTRKFRTVKFNQLIIMKVEELERKQLSERAWRNWNGPMSAPESVRVKRDPNTEGPPSRIPGNRFN